jgi:ABC-2 type transport system ATP-binding protein
VAEPMIRVRGVSKDFVLPHLRQRTLKGHFINLFRRGRIVKEAQHALRDIDFDVARGEFLGVVGRNGSGKSTLLKILAGIYQPTSGQVTVAGRLVPFIELGVGFNAELTGRENVYLNGALLGFSRSEIDAMYDDIVAFAELEEAMDQKLKNYSSGMQVRIAFSVATRARADVLLIDEVLAVGDTAFQRKCFEHFRALKKSDTTIVFVTHDMGAVREFCDRAILIEDSHLIADGSAEDVATQYAMLFNTAPHQAGSAQAAQPKDRRWGDGRARYADITVPEVLVDQSPLVVELEVVAEADLEEVVVGLSISDSVGTIIMATDSAQRRQPCRDLAKGERVQVTWSVPNVFSDGLHHIGLTLSDRRGLTIYDSWKEAAAFTVVKEEKSPYVVTPDSSLRLIRVRDDAARPVKPFSA